MSVVVDARAVTHAAQDQPGQKVVWSASYDGISWTPTNTTANELFPSMNSTQNPGVALFAEPAIVVNGHYYVAASPIQFCLYPVRRTSGRCVKDRSISMPP